MATKTDTSALAKALSGKASRVSITPASNGFVVDTDHDTGKGDYVSPDKSVYSDIEGVKGHLDQHLPAKGKKKVIDTGKHKIRKVRVIDTTKRK